MGGVRRYLQTRVRRADCLTMIDPRVAEPPWPLTCILTGGAPDRLVDGARGSWVLRRGGRNQEQDGADRS